MKAMRSLCTSRGATALSVLRAGALCIAVLLGAHGTAADLPAAEDVQSDSDGVLWHPTDQNADGIRSTSKLVRTAAALVQHLQSADATGARGVQDRLVQQAIDNARNAARERQKVTAGPEHDGLADGRVSEPLSAGSAPPVPWAAAPVADNAQLDGSAAAPVQQPPAQPADGSRDDEVVLSSTEVPGSTVEDVSANVSMSDPDSVTDGVADDDVAQFDAQPTIAAPFPPAVAASPRPNVAPAAALLFEPRDTPWPPGAGYSVAATQDGA